MIQRIQSIYLLVAALISGGLISIVSLWTNSKTEVYASNLLASTSLVEKCIPVLFFISALIALTTLFLFKNRKLQFVLNRCNMLINLFLLGALIYVSLILPGETSVFKKGIGMFLPIIVILLLVLANKAIKKDEDLVKSVDRLR
ncbi:conserved membrane hypothetical protein [Tenacibaculum maritimum]|uniref:DUF4293 domain-containing protein n=1 Tax=Tenacibaculum maritimum TaxID=107401 RepID=UPI0012E55AE9|nr:DUF4293 domain-containing protein [Tenacibaculum maritimum]CAA0193699.1 conserved membrane hypothetical protein [Tenacibaculum maritimum]CAA0238395.1 conserved membrane hypothetical protein [Tenacibaculum maritimum]